MRINRLFEPKMLQGLDLPGLSDHAETRKNEPEGARHEKNTAAGQECLPSLSNIHARVLGRQRAKAKLADTVILAASFCLKLSPQCVLVGGIEAFNVPHWD